MLKKILFPLLIMVFVCSGFLSSQTLKYTSPVKNSQYNMENTTVILEFGNSFINLKDLNLKVIGSISGTHKGIIKILDTRKKRITFIPNEPFALGETVTVSGYRNSESFNFHIRSRALSDLDFITNRINILTGSLKPETGGNKYSNKLTDSIPAITINQFGETAPGSLFISSFANISGDPSYLLVIDNNGTVRFSKRLAIRAYDFKRQNDYYVYYDESFHKYLALDSTFNVVDSFYTGNGYVTDVHECILEPDNSAWLMSYDPQIVDMSLIVPGGKVNAIVIGLIIQKINPEKNVVFQWRSWDHIPITDASHQDLTSSNIDYIHGNSIEKDHDGNIIISSRHLDEITKINSQTGGIIWRLGGKQNQFTFTNDTAGFYYQHSARRLPNNNLILFDNGNFHVPKYSRVIEYKLNDTLKTAEVVWEYRNNPSIFSIAMGNVQRLPNGNTLIGWGVYYPRTLTEVNSNKNILLTLALSYGNISYRAFRQNPFDVITNTGTEQNLPVSYSLEQNYPNPFNPETKISYTIPSSGFVKLTVFNSLGVEVAELVNEKKSPGKYTVHFSGNGLSSGIYFYRISVNGFSESRKMMLIK